jgi:hypothetical protein
MYEPLIKERIETAIDEGLNSQAALRGKKARRTAFSLAGTLRALFRRTRRAGRSRPAPIPGKPALLLVLGAAVIGACSAPAAPATPTPTQPPAPTDPAPLSNTDVVLAMVERLNAGDVEGSLGYFTDDAMVYLMGFPPTGIEVYGGKEQIRTLWEDSVANHFEWEVVITKAQGNDVFVQAQTWHDFTSAIGVAPLAYTDVYEVVEGRIVTYSSWITGESLGRFKPAFAEAVPPETPAPVDFDLAVAELSVTIADGTCATDAPPVLRAGEVTVNLDVQDRDNSLYALTLFNLDEGRDFLDLMASTAGWQPGWADMLLMEELGPGKEATYTFTAERGPVYLVCWSKPPDIPIGNAGPFQVIP